MFLLAASNTATSGSLLLSLVDLVAYAFYLFSGCALAYCAIQYKLGNSSAIIRGFLGAALFAIAPTFIWEILSFLN